MVLQLGPDSIECQDIDCSGRSTARSSTVSNIYPAADPHTPVLVSSHDSHIPRITEQGSKYPSSYTLSQSQPTVQPAHTTMNTSRAGSTPAASRTHSEADRHEGQHARQESGYQSSTIGTNSLPPMTIGVKRGTDLLASRRGPQITGNKNNATSNSTHARSGSAPPHATGAGHAHDQSTGNLSIQEIFDYGEFTQRAQDYNAAVNSGRVPGAKPVYVGTGTLPNHPIHSNDDNYDDQHSEEGRQYGEHSDESESEDDGIEPAEGYNEDEEQESQVDNFRLPDDADPAMSVLNKSQTQTRTQQQKQQGNIAQQQFYQLRQDHDHDDDDRGERSPLSLVSDSRGQLLSSEALAGESNPSLSIRHQSRRCSSIGTGARLQLRERVLRVCPENTFLTTCFSPCVCDLLISSHALWT